LCKSLERIQCNTTHLEGAILKELRLPRSLHGGYYDFNHHTIHEYHCLEKAKACLYIYYRQMLKGVYVCKDTL
jgi:hypothetical protein